MLIGISLWRGVRFLGTFELSHARRRDLAVWQTLKFALLQWALFIPFRRKGSCRSRDALGRIISLVHI